MTDSGLHDLETEEAVDLPSSATDATTPSLPLIESSRKKRRHSTSSLNMLSSASNADFMPQVVAAARFDPTAQDHKREREHSSSSSEQGHKSAQPQATRLKFLDYLIKPVQRICRYPLLLDQLKTKRPRTLSAGNFPLRMDASMSNGEMGLDAVERACESMRLVVSLVDRASETRAQLVRSASIASRMIFTLPPTSASNHGHPSSSSSGQPARSTSPPSRTQGLTPEFVASLGPCHLVGALDIVHHPSVLHAPNSGSLRAKYLGTFLYRGGYLILVKIPKSGKVYEPRYWFSLAGFELLNSEDDECELLPALLGGIELNIAGSLAAVLVPFVRPWASPPVCGGVSLGEGHLDDCHS